MKKNGNITRLRRSGLTDNLHGGFGLVDNLHMTYEGNMLTSVRDSASHLPYSGATDFDGVSGQEYPLTYNASGSLLSDAGRGIARIDYDRLNNPVRIQFTDGSVTRYVYSAAGEKLCVTHLTAVPNITVALGSVRELAPSEILSADSTDYLLGGSLTLRNGRIDKLQFDEGYCQATKYIRNFSQDNFTFYYYDRDHLGSIRQVVKETGSNNGSIVQTMDYYPFGAEFCHSSTASEVQSRKNNGKEFDNMHGLNTYDYGARQYYPILGRWDRMDPLCEKYYDVSPYAYCHDNPIKFIDIKGFKPGDFFHSMDAAAIDFGMFYNDNSIRENREYNSSILLVYNDKGEKGYTYTLPSKGTFEESTPSKEEGFTHVAFVHAHAGYSKFHHNNRFSGLTLDDKDGNPIRYYTEEERKASRSLYDIGIANRKHQTAYVSTPNGSLQKYDSDTGKISVISNDMPSDKNDPDRLNSRGTEERNATDFDYNTYSKTMNHYLINNMFNLINSMK